MANNFIKETLVGIGADLIHEDGRLARRKNSLTSLANGVLQIINGAAFMLTDVPAWVSAIVLVVGFIAEVIVQASMKGSVTPSVVQKFADRAGEGLGEADIETYSPERSHVSSFSDNAPEVDSYQDLGEHVIREAGNAFSSYITPLIKR